MHAAFSPTQEPRSFAAIISCNQAAAAMARASPVQRGESTTLAGFLSPVDLTSAVRDQAFHLHSVRGVAPTAIRNDRSLVYCWVKSHHPIGVVSTIALQHYL